MRILKPAPEASILISAFKAESEQSVGSTCGRLSEVSTELARSPNMWFKSMQHNGDTRERLGA